MDDLAPLRLMGPAQRHAFDHLIWLFTRGDDDWATNQLVFWTDTRIWQADVKVRRIKFEDRNIFWPYVSPEELISLLPEEEKAKATAASLGIMPPT